MRDLVKEEARRWLGTPYHHSGNILGVGVDCAQLLLEVFANAGLIQRFSPNRYTSDWHLHRNEEKYLEVIERYATLLDNDERSLSDRPDLVVKTGNILMWRVGRTFSHSAIVTDWPFIIHAYQPSRIVEEVDVRGTPMSFRNMRIYSCWGD